MPRIQIERGTRHVSARVSLVVESAKKERFEQLARRAGVSYAAFYEAVVDHLETELTDRGLPNWWPQPELEDGELPINAP